MYWPTSTARRLHLSPSGLLAGDDALDDAEAEASIDGAQSGQDGVVHMSRSLDGQLWASVSADTLAVWSVRPTHVLAALIRTKKSVREYGANKQLRWKADGMGIVVETEQSFLLLYSLHYVPQRQSQMYHYTPSNGTGARSRVTKELLAPSLTTLRSSFAPGPGEGTPLGESKKLALDIRFQLVLRIDAGLAASACTDDYLLVSTRSPPAVQCIPWPERSSSDSQDEGNDSREKPLTRTSVLTRLDWVLQESIRKDNEAEQKAKASVHAAQIIYSHEMDIFLWITSDGRVYCSYVHMDSRTSIWRGKCFHGALSTKRRRSSAYLSATQSIDEVTSVTSLEEGQKATCAAINARFSLLSVGQSDGCVIIYTFRAVDKVALPSHTFSIRTALRSTASYLKTGRCTSLAWTSDGHALAVAWEHGWSVWSTFGKLMACSLTDNWQDASTRFSDTFMKGVRDIFWGPGSTDLFLLSHKLAFETQPNAEQQLFVLPFAKSAVAGQHSPDNTRYASIQLDDSILVYRGSDQPDMSIINPESDVWHQVKIPEAYLAVNWPIRYACISSDGRLIAVAGSRGLTHFSSLSGRWKQFQQSSHEQKFYVEGGMQWYQHVLVAACRVPATEEHQIRLYSRDLNLDEASVLYTEHFPSAIVLTSLFDNSLLVYTADNTLHHFLITITDIEIGLTLCGSITFEGVVGEPARVRGMSWLVPNGQQQFGDPMNDLMLATIIFLIDGKLVLLRPRRSSNNDEEEEVSYDMQILGDRIEFYWTHLQGVGTLENSLWGYDGSGIKLWLDALTIEQADVIAENDDEDEKPEYRTIEESLSIPLDFYPLCVLIEKGIIIGVEPEVSLRRSLEFAIFRNTTNTQLFIQHVLRSYLTRRQMKDAVLFASFYHPLVYFAHALEILLHDVLEEEADSMSAAISPSMSSDEQDNSLIEHLPHDPTATIETVSDITDQENQSKFSSKAADLSPLNKVALLPLVVAFLDHFDECLEVVVNCARKTEVARWKHLFSIVGDPRELFELCLQRGHYKTAGSYLLVLHNLDSIEESQTHTIRLLSLARRYGWFNLCKDLLRFTRSLDDDGKALQAVVSLSGLTKADDSPDHPSEEIEQVKEEGLTSTPMAASQSLPNVKEPVIVEEEEEGEEIGNDQNSVVANGQLQAGDTPFKRVSMQRSSSLFSPGTHHSRPPMPSLGVNGRIMPASPSPGSSRRESLSNSFASNVKNGSISAISDNSTPQRPSSLRS